MTTRFTQCLADTWRQLMTFHGWDTPRSMPNLSYWRDYIVSRAVEASCGLIPVHAALDRSQVRPIYVCNHRIMPDTDPNMKNA